MNRLKVMTSEKDEILTQMGPVLGAISFDSMARRLNKIKARAVFYDIYHFFGVAIAMKSDQKEPLDWFRQLYPRFRMEKADRKADATYYMMVKTPNAPLVIAEEASGRKVKMLEDKDALSFYAHLFAFNYIAAHLKSHFLLHGAAVSRNGMGVVIVGNSYAGKSTLTLELVYRRGFKFLSDDQVALNRTTHQIDPFPRSIGIREHTLTLFDHLEYEQVEPHTIAGGERKWFVDFSKITENRIGASCHLKSLVFLVKDLEESKAEKDHEEHIVLVVDHVNDTLLEKLRRSAKTEVIQHRHLSSCDAVSFYAKTEAISALALERLCESCGVWLLDMRKHNSVKPNYQVTPKLQKIPHSIATFELLAALQSDFRAKPLQTYMELAGMIADVECYRLSIGKLDEMAEHVCKLM